MSTTNASSAEKQHVEWWFNSSKYENPYEPEVRIDPCVCGKLPSLHSSCGGFNYYDYYSCNECGLFATGHHQFPFGVYVAMSSQETPSEPKLFVRYNGEHNAENGWNKFIRAHSERLVDNPTT